LQIIPKPLTPLQFNQHNLNFDCFVASFLIPENI
jgi:hypothetical protein